MGLACLFSTPNSSPFLSTQNAFVILLSVLIQMGEKEQEKEEIQQQQQKKMCADSGKPAVVKCSRSSNDLTGLPALHFCVSVNLLF